MYYKYTQQPRAQNYYIITYSANSALILVIEHQEGHLACKNTVPVISKSFSEDFLVPLANRSKTAVWCGCISLIQSAATPSQHRSSQYDKWLNYGSTSIFLALISIPALQVCHKYFSLWVKLILISEKNFQICERTKLLHVNSVIGLLHMNASAHKLVSASNHNVQNTFSRPAHDPSITRPATRFEFRNVTREILTQIQCVVIASVSLLCSICCGCSMQDQAIISIWSSHIKDLFTGHHHIKLITEKLCKVLINR